MWGALLRPLVPGRVSTVQGVLRKGGLKVSGWEGHDGRLDFFNKYRGLLVSLASCVKRD